MKTQLKDCLHYYLNTGLKVQYKGVLNGSEISKYEKEYYKENPDATHFDMIFGDSYNPPEEKTGLKVAKLISIEYWNNGPIYHVGKKKGFLKTFRNTKDFKPLLYPLSHLTKPIKVEGYNDGKEFVPAAKLAELGFDPYIIPDMRLEDIPFGLVQLLLKWHFDVFSLIDSEQAIDKTTIK